MKVQEYNYALLKETVETKINWIKRENIVYKKTWILCKVYGHVNISKKFGLEILFLRSTSLC